MILINRSDQKKPLNEDRLFLPFELEIKANAFCVHTTESTNNTNSHTSMADNGRGSKILVFSDNTIIWTMCLYLIL